MILGIKNVEVGKGELRQPGGDHSGQGVFTGSFWNGPLDKRNPKALQGHEILT